MENCFRCLKYLVAIFNLMILIIGLLIECSFVYFNFTSNIFIDVHSHLTYILYFFIAFGAVLTVVGFLGCCGAIQESKCLLGTFFFLVVIIFGGQVAVCIWSYVNFRVIEGEFQGGLKMMMKSYYDDQSIRITIDSLQETIECCGSKGPEDWKLIQPLRTVDSYKLPPSCCSTNETKVCTIPNVIVSRMATSDSFYNKGCSETFFDYIKKYKFTLLAVVIVVSLIQVFALIFSLILCITFGKMESYYDY